MTKDEIMMMDIKTIREAVLKNRGGLENVDDAGIMGVWNMLTEETKAEYLESVKCEVQNEKPKRKT